LISKLDVFLYNELSEKSILRQVVKINNTPQAREKLGISTIIGAVAEQTEPGGCDVV
jgi:hypothetical protein